MVAPVAVPWLLARAKVRFRCAAACLRAPMSCVFLSLALFACENRVTASGAKFEAPAPRDSGTKPEAALLRADATPENAMARCSAPTSLPPPPPNDPALVPTNYFARVARHSEFYDARAVGGKLVIVGCKRVHILDDDLVHGRDVPGLPTGKASCVSVVGVKDQTLVVYAKGPGLIAIHVPEGDILWQASVDLPAECERGKQDPRSPPLWSRYEVLDATSASTCRSVVMADDTVVAWEAAGRLTGRRADTGVMVWHEDVAKPPRTARLLADRDGHVFQPLPASKVLRALEGPTGRRLWQATLDDVHPTRGSLLGSSGLSGDEYTAALWEASMGSTPSGVWVEKASRLEEFAGGDGSETVCLQRDVALAPPVTFLGSYALEVRSHLNVASDRQSVFVTDGSGRLVAYSRATGAEEWAYGILALGLEWDPQPLYTLPRVEWLGSTEVLVGLGIGPTGSVALSLFRKGTSPQVERIVTVEGRIASSWDLSGMEVQIGPHHAQADKHGKFSTEISGRGSFRLSCRNARTLGSHLEPQTVDIDLEAPPTLVHVTFAIREYDESNAPQTGGEP